MFGNYNKLAGAILGTLAGNVVAFAFVYLAFKGVAVCEVVDQVESCSVTLLGFKITQAQVVGAIVGVINAAGVYWAKKNVEPV